MKTVTLKQAQGHLEQLFNEALSGKPVVLSRGRRRVMMRACGSLMVEREWAEFIESFPSHNPEPRGTRAKIRHIIKDVRCNGSDGKPN